MAIKCLLISGKPKPLPPPRSQSLETFISKKGYKDEDDNDSDDDDEDNEVDDVDEKDNTVDESFGPTDQNKTQLTSPTSEPTVYANLGQLRSGLAPNKPQRTGSIHDDEEIKEPVSKPTASPAISSRKLSLPSISSSNSLSTLPNNCNSGVLPGHSSMFHAKTSSITGSINSEAMSDSTISFPSSTARKMMDGSEADSERDSVSPQRLSDEVLLSFLHKFKN